MLLFVSLPQFHFSRRFLHKTLFSDIDPLRFPDPCWLPSLSSFRFSFSVSVFASLESKPGYCDWNPSCFLYGSPFDFGPFLVISGGSPFFFRGLFFSGIACSERFDVSSCVTHVFPRVGLLFFFLVVCLTLPLLKPYTSTVSGPFAFFFSFYDPPLLTSSNNLSFPCLPWIRVFFFIIFRTSLVAKRGPGTFPVFPFRVSFREVWRLFSEVL